MSWEFHPARESFASFATDWDRLNAELYGSHPFFDSRFVGPMLKYSGEGRERLCLYRIDGCIKAALILLPRGLGCWITFHPVQAKITPLLFADSCLLKELFVALPGFVWRVEFHAVDPRFAPKLSNASGTTLATEYYTTIRVESDSGFETYWEQRPEKLRSAIQSYTTHLENAGTPAGLTLVTSPQDMPDCLRRFEDLDRKGWKAVKGNGPPIDDIRWPFYAEVLANFAANGQVKIYELTIGGQIVASRMLIGNEHMLVNLKTSNDDAPASNTTERLLLERMLRQQLANDRSRSVEFYAFRNHAQSEWATAQPVSQNIHVFRGDVTITFYTVAKAMLRFFMQGLESTNAPHESGVGGEVGWSDNVEKLPVGRGTNWSLPCENIEESLEWFKLLQTQVYPDDKGVIYCHASKGDQLIVVLPLRKTRQGGIRTLESLSNYYTSLYSPLFGAEMQRDVLQVMLRSAAQQGGGTHVMRFAPMDSESSEYADLLQALRDAGWVPFTFFCFGNWYLKVTEGWAGYLKGRGGNLRSSIKRRSRDFLAAGGELEVVSHTGNLDEAIVAYNQVYAASWKKPEPYPNFVPSLIKLVAERGMLRLGVARLHGKPVASQLWIVGKDKASIYKVAYDEAYASYSPGTVLTSFLMQHVIEADGVTEVDFLIGDDTYKQLWMSHRRERWGIVAYNRRSIFGCLLLVKELLGRSIKRRLSPQKNFLFLAKEKFDCWRQRQKSAVD